MLKYTQSSYFAVLRFKKTCSPVAVYIQTHTRKTHAQVIWLFHSAFKSLHLT
uniref:Uncharacterized protein n=1 Tax=Anguilla anguilla TaxID=7936 RepID=A0A0E9RNL4_ANGAN